MKTSLILCLCIATLSFACSTAPAASDDAVAETKSASLLDVHEVTVHSPRGSEKFFTIGADGKVTVVDNGAPVPPGHYTTIAPDGSVTLADGTPFLTMSADGKITAADGSVIPITIAEDGTATNADMPKPMTFDAQGNLGEEGIGDFAKVEHLGGEDSPKARRAVALAFISVFVYAQKNRGAEKSSESAPMPAAGPASRGSGGLGGVGGVGTTTENALEDDEPADQM